MKRLAAGLLVVASLGFSAKATAQTFEKSYALVIAISKYQSPKWVALASATREAERLSDLLKGQGFQVASLYNEKATKIGINSALLDLARKLNPRDRVLVYFGGHGYTEAFVSKDYGYIVPYDGGENSASYVSMEELQTHSEKMGRALHQLFLLNSCFGGLFAVRGSGVDPSTPNYIAEITRRKARQVITAGGKNQQVVDAGPDGLSPFVSGLLEAIGQGKADANGDSFVTFSELTAFLQRRSSNSYQTPAAGTLPGDELGDFVFRGVSLPIRTTTNSSPPGTVTRGDQSVNEALKQYQQAYENMDVKALLMVFPSFSGRLELESKFSDLRSIKMELGEPAIRQSSDTSAQATCDHMLIYTSKSGKVERTKPQRAEFQLTKIGSVWRIESVRFK